MTEELQSELWQANLRALEICRQVWVFTKEQATFWLPAIAALVVTILDLPEIACKECCDVDCSQPCTETQWIDNGSDTESLSSDLFMVHR